MKRWLILLFVIILSGCSMERYTPVMSKGTLVITTNQKDGSVSFINDSSHSVLTTWNVKKAIMGSVLFPDGDTLALYGKQLSTISLYSISKGKKIGEWNVGTGIVNMMVSPNKDKVALADQTTNSIRMYTFSGKESARIPIGQSPLTFIQDEKNLYVVTFLDGKFSTIDWNTNQQIRSVAVPVTSAGAVLQGGNLWLGGHGNGDQVNESIHIFDVKSGNLVRSIPASQMPISFATDGKSVYVLSHGTATLWKFNSRTFEEEAKLEVGSNPFAIMLVGNTLYVASYDSDEVIAVDTASMNPIATIGVGKGPFHFTIRKGEGK